jgi:CAAX protease family protein
VFSALFGLGHIEQGIDAAFATAFLGAAWGTVYLARRSIVAPMVSHAAFNLAQLVKYLTLAVR